MHVSEGNDALYESSVTMTVFIFNKIYCCLGGCFNCLS